MIVRSVRIWVLAAVAATGLAAGRADALTVVFNGPGGYGISAASAANAAAAGVPIVTAQGIMQAASLDLTIPAPDVLSYSLSGSPSVASPNTAISRWSVTNGGSSYYEGLPDVWLVFFNPVTYTPSQVGFEIDGDDGWAVISVLVPFGMSSVEYFYPARYLGDMDSGVTVDFLMRHVIGEALNSDGQNLVLPRYSVGALVEVPLPVPEPSALITVSLSLALAALLRRRQA